MSTQSSTPVDDLREAAKQLRAQASAATPGPWFADAWEIYAERVQGSWVGETLVDDHEQATANGFYVASMHPLIGLALADWLAAHAFDLHRAGGDFRRCESPSDTTFAALLARLYLGRA